MKKVLIIIFTLVCTVTLLAQNSKENTEQNVLYILLPVQDFMTHSKIDSLKAELLNADYSFADSAKVQTFGWGDRAETSVSFTIAKPGNYLIKLVAPGYADKFVEVNIPKMYKRERFRQWKKQFMHKAKKLEEYDLDEVVVTATKLKFYMDGDTLVYNADAFNLSEGSMLNSLVKKLPGVEINSNGEIKVNGRKVDSMLLNGKNFFNSDRELLLENMPAYMVKSLQAFERAPEEVRGTAREKTTQKELVLNVKLKREYNGAWISNIQLGISPTDPASTSQADGRNNGRGFLARLFSMHFNDRSRLVFFGSANNLNDYHDPGEKGEWTPLQQSTGLASAYKFGVNGNYEKESGLAYEGRLAGTYGESDNTNHTNSETFLSGGSTYGLSYQNQRSYNFGIETSHRVSFHNNEKIIWIFNHPWFNLDPSFSYSRWNNPGTSASTTLAADVASQLGKNWLDSIMKPDAGETLKKYAINRITNSTRNKGHHVESNINLGGFWSVPHNDMIFFHLTSTFYYKNREEDSFEHYRLDYPNNALASNDFRNRYTPNTDRNRNFSVNPEVGFFLNSKMTTQLTFNNHFSHNYSYSNRSLYLLNKLESWDDTAKHPMGTLPSVDELLLSLDADNSTFNETTVTTNVPSISFRTGNSNEEGFRMLNFDLPLNIKHESMRYIQGQQADTLLTRNTVLFNPSVTFIRNQYRKGREFHVGYNMNCSAPGLTNLLPIRNTADPLNTYTNNPSLKNTTTHSASIFYRDEWHSTLFNASLGGNVVRNATAMGFVYNKTTGARVFTPTNVNGNWSLNSVAGIDFRITKDDKIRMKSNVSWNHNCSVDISSTFGMDDDPKSTVNSNYYNGSSEIVYRPNDRIELMAKGNIHYQVSTSERRDFMTINVYDFDYGMMAQLELPWQWKVATDITMYSRRGYSDKTMNTNELVWNARLSRPFTIKGIGSFTFMADAFDLLGNLSNVRRTINAQGKTETFYNVIPSYCLLRLAYKF